MKKLKLQKIISFVAIILIALHLIFPNLSIDIITVALFAIAIIPWLSPLFKSIGLPGGVTAEFRDLEIVKDKINKVGLLKTPIHNHPFYIPSLSDPNLVLAWLRIEIEKRLRQLGKSHQINEERSMNKMLDELGKRNVLSRQEVSVLQDLKNTLNRAIHGMKVDTRIARWALDIGPQVLTALDEKISHQNL